LSTLTAKFIRATKVMLFPVKLWAAAPQNDPQKLAFAALPKGRIR
jgi:hypothetical protein